MNKKPDFEQHEAKWLKDLPVTTENISFSSEQMISCESCNRSNPPNRLNCFYCGAQLKVSTNSDLLRLNWRKPENWEKGFNIIWLANSDTNLDTAAVAAFLRMEKADLEKIFAFNQILPVARVSNLEEAELIKNRLEKFGANAKIVSDEELQTELPPRRLRRIDWSENEIRLLLFSHDETHTISPESLSLVVVGMIVERQVKTSERRKREEKQLLQMSETSSDEIVLDLYTSDDQIGWRVMTGGFDFTGLGSRKKLLAVENIKTLIEIFREIAPNALIIEDYRKLRAVLSLVWEPEEKSDNRGLQRQGLGKFNNETVTYISNLTQFNRFSRLQNVKL